MLISTLNCEMWPNFSYRGVRSVQLLLLLLLLMVFSSENFGCLPPYAGIAGIGPDASSSVVATNFIPAEKQSGGNEAQLWCLTTHGLSFLKTSYQDEIMQDEQERASRVQKCSASKRNG